MPAGQTQDVGVNMELGSSAHEMLGPTMTMNRQLRVRNNDLVMQIHLSR